MSGKSKWDYLKAIYCLTLGGAKPAPLGDSFSTFARQYDNVVG